MRPFSPLRIYLWTRKAPSACVRSTVGLIGYNVGQRFRPKHATEKSYAFISRHGRISAVYGPAAIQQPTVFRTWFKTVRALVFVRNSRRRYHSPGLDVNRSGRRRRNRFDDNVPSAATEWTPYANRTVRNSIMSRERRFWLLIPPAIPVHTYAHLP